MGPREQVSDLAIACLQNSPRILHADTLLACCLKLATLHLGRQHKRDNLHKGSERLGCILSQLRCNRTTIWYRGQFCKIQRGHFVQLR